MQQAILMQQQMQQAMLMQQQMQQAPAQLQLSPVPYQT
jgi:hypothetical protein